MAGAMKPVFPLLAAAGLCVAGPLAAQERAGGRPAISYANPSAAIAAELALAQAGRERGHWAALAGAAAPDAVLFTPAIAWAQPWLKGRASPPQAWSRDPHQVWASCDGSLLVGRGAWRREGKVGRFTTIWQRQPDGVYRWVLEDSVALADPPRASEMIAALVADCPERTPRPDGAGAVQGSGKPGKPGPAKPKAVKLKDLPPLDPARHAGRAADGSLRWEVAVDGAGQRHLKIFWNRDGRETGIVDDGPGPA